MDKEKLNSFESDEEVVEIVDELDSEVLDLLLRLYDKTMKDLVNR